MATFRNFVKAPKNDYGTSGSIKPRTFVDWLKNYQAFKKLSVSYNHLISGHQAYQPRTVNNQE